MEGIQIGYITEAMHLWITRIIQPLCKWTLSVRLSYS